MSPPAPDPTSSSVLATLAKALKAESTQLGAARHELTLFSGEYLGAFAEHFYYRFEIPEEIYLSRIERASSTFGQSQPVTFEGRIVSLDNQFLMVGLPMDLGSILPEIKCIWTHEEHLKLTLDALGGAEDVHPVASILLEPEREMYFCVERDPRTERM